MDIEQEELQPNCNPATVTDGRGGIFTWIPKEPIVEFNMLYFLPGKTRGHHYHPEFIEYFLVVEGSGLMVSRDKDSSGKNKLIHMSRGSCVRNPIGLAHAFHAITPVTAIALLTKKWDDCSPPIVQCELK